MSAGAVPALMRAGVMAAPYINRVIHHPATKTAVKAATKQASRAAKHGRTLIGRIITEGSLGTRKMQPGEMEAIKMIVVNELWGGGVGGQAMMRGRRTPLKVTPPPPGYNPAQRTGRRVVMTGTRK